MNQKRFFSLVLAFLLIVTSLSLPAPDTYTYAATSLVQKTYVDKARYSPLDTATISVDLSNTSGTTYNGTLYLQIFHLDTSVYSTSKSISVGGNSESTETFTWTTPSTDFKGYMVKTYIDSIDFKTTAIDVSSDWTKFPRYGYTGDFPSTESTAQSTAKIETLTQDFHINAFQFYDWMWKHDKLIKRTGETIDSTWQDLFNRTISWDTINDQIDAAQADNAAAMAYVMSYATREEYDQNSVESKWGLYGDRNHTSQLNVDFGDQSTYLWLFNPANEGWQDYIVDEYKDAVNAAGFDGLQIDQMGQRSNIYDYYGKEINLFDTFSDLVNAAKTSLTINNATKDVVTFNVVDGTADGWALNDVSKNANTDFDFSEIWWKSDNYNDMKNYIEQFRTQNGGKALVLAAYMNYEDNSGIRYEAESATLNSVNTNTNHTGYTGSGFVEGFGDIGDYVEFSLSLSEGSLVPLVFRYANDIGATATRTVYVDGINKGKVNFSDLSNWDTWAHDAYLDVAMTSGNHTVKLAYDSDDTGAINLDSLTFGQFNEHSVRLANATFAASGAGHIEMGADVNQPMMLAHEYYPMKSKVMSSSLTDAMMEHYDFITAYENLLFDAYVNYGDQGFQWATISGESISGSGEAGKIWTINRQYADYKILHLINLTNESDTEWRNETSQPTFKTDLAVKYYVDDNSSVSGVYLASPDLNDGLTESLSHTTSIDSSGSYISFTVPSLKYWDMIYIDTSFSLPTNSIYEAEDAIKTNVTTATNHTGYSGASFVDGFASENDTVSFIIDAADEDDYSLFFRYANSTGSTATRALFVDGKYRGTVYFEDLANWDTWAEGEIGVNLEPGKHTIVLLYGTNETNAINLDYLRVEKKLESTRSLYMNNWNDSVFIWKETEVNGAQALLADGPGIYEIRHYNETASGNYNTNQIKNYSTFLRDETDTINYTTGSKFRSTGYFGSDGVLYNDYTTYDGTPLIPQIQKAYAVVPNEDFMVVKYTITNTDTSTKTFNILDMLHVSNETANNASASYNSNTKTTTITSANSEGYLLAHGTLESTIDGYQVADDTITTTSDAKASPWVTFNNDGTLKNNASVTANDISTGFNKKVTLAADASTEFYFFLAVGENTTEIDAAITQAQSQSGGYWFTKMGTDYSDWLAEGQNTSFTDTDMNTAYDRILITIKQSTVPGTYDDSGNTVVKYAAMPAATNPSAYSYKVWARDSAVSAMSLDASGHLEEAESYWYWLADRQISTDEGGWKKPGTFWTCYWIWDNSSVSFVEPEYDSIGMFLVGAYQHYDRLTGTAKTDFLNNIWDAYKRSADFVFNNIQSNGFGIADCSIWEEAVEYNAFTQALYIAGLDAAQMMADAKGLTSLADNYNGAASTMRSAVQRDSTDNPSGLWNKTDGYYNRAVTTAGAPRTTHDSSSNVLISYGVVDAESMRAYNHIRNIIEAIGHDDYGVARYDGDTFYTGVNSWDPGGNEVFENEPSWPQMAMWIGMYEINSGYKAYKANALRRLKWYTERMAMGFIPIGETFSNVTLKPAISTTVEPITGAAYVMTALAYEGKFNMRILPPQFNAGAYKNITVSSDTTGDWSQWSNIPYYKDTLGDTAVNDNTYDIKKVYVANDANNLYIRIDTVGSDLPGYQSPDKFAMQVYSEDFASSASTYDKAMNGADLSRSMSYQFARWNDGTGLNKFTTGGSSWSYDKNVTSVIEPQWESSSGRIEIVIPFSELSSTGSVSDDDWANMDIVLSKMTSSSPETWVEADSISIHYRKTASTSSWLWGNIDE